MSRRVDAPGTPGHIARWLADRTTEQERGAALERAALSAPVYATHEQELAEDAGIGHGFFPFEGG